MKLLHFAISLSDYSSVAKTNLYLFAKCVCTFLLSFCSMIGDLLRLGDIRGYQSMACVRLYKAGGHAKERSATEHVPSKEHMSSMHRYLLSGLPYCLNFMVLFPKS